jgi:hypothetical protein
MQYKGGNILDKSTSNGYIIHWWDYLDGWGMRYGI